MVLIAAGFSGISLILRTGKIFLLSGKLTEWTGKPGTLFGSAIGGAADAIKIGEGCPHLTQGGLPHLYVAISAF